MPEKNPNRSSTSTNARSQVPSDTNAGTPYLINVVLESSGSKKRSIPSCDIYNTLVTNHWLLKMYNIKA